MPEIKNQFTGGKMNKDLDERLVPKGEYRDAMNIQVTTSEGSDVGTIQNILGNTFGCNYNYGNPIPAGSTTVGSISDEKNDVLYWLVAGPGNIEDFLPLGPDAPPVSLKDLILKKYSSTAVQFSNNPAFNQSTDVCQPIFVDQWGYCVNIQDNELADVEVNSLTLPEGVDTQNITVGMYVTGYDAGGNIVDADSGSFDPTLITGVGVLTTIPVSYYGGEDIVYTNPTPNSYQGIRLRTFTSDLGTWLDTTPGGSNQSGIYSGGQSFVPANGESQIFVPTGVYGPDFQIGSTIETDVNGFYPNGGEIVNIVFGSISTSMFGGSPPYEQGYLVTIDTDAINMPQPINSPFSEDTYPPFTLEVTRPVGQIITPNNTIVVSSNSQQWLDEIYNLGSYGEGIDDNPSFLSVNNSLGNGVNYPPGCCIDPATISPPDINGVYDNTFSLIPCDEVDFVSPIPNPDQNACAAIAINTDNGRDNSLVFNILGGDPIDQIFLNNNITIGNAVDVCFTSERVLNFDPDRLITGINIIDDMLFWTDNFSEPKKINIPRSITGTNQSGNIHTAVVNSATGYDLLNYNPIREENITVIKRGPKSALRLKTYNSIIDEINSNVSGVVTISDASNLQYSTLWSQREAFDQNNNLLGNPSLPYDFSGFSSAESNNILKIIIKSDLDGNTNFNLDLWSVGSTVVLKEYDENGQPPSLPIVDYTIKGKIDDWIWNDNDVNDFGNDGSSAWGAKVSIKIDSIVGIPPTADPITSFRDYAIELFDEEAKLFEFKFPRFSYRYKYEDGEYSTFAPWTSVAFMPGDFDYHPQQGYNLGMSNRLHHLNLENFITQDMPKDVVEIDMLYKDDQSPNVYVVETIRPDDETTISQGGNMWNNWQLNKFTIKKENIRAVLPSNQMLRPWDNVPQKALAQEITGNRIVYGNYVQNFDIDNFTPLFNHYLQPEDDGSNIKSIKSLREYQLGVVFTDEYGRETPVITNNSGTFDVKKDNASNANKLVMSMSNNAVPLSAKYFKFYIKQTSGEYYNLAMDRYYNAEDGNVWIAFPSTDRNKIDIDSFIILKKGVDSDELVLDPARFKVIAIENEAPDFIKLKKTIISEKTHINGSKDIFGDENNPGTIQYERPAFGSRTFDIIYSEYLNSSIRRLHEDTSSEGALYFQLRNTTTNYTSKAYKVEKIMINEDEKDVARSGSVAQTTPNPTHWSVNLEEGWGSDLYPLTDSLDGANITKINSNVSAVFWRHKVENSPEFDGRFFVKVFVDDTFRRYIIENAPDDNTEWITVESQKIYSFDKTKHAKAWNSTSVNWTSQIPLPGDVIGYTGDNAMSGSIYDAVVETNLPLTDGTGSLLSYFNATNRTAQYVGVSSFNPSVQAAAGSTTAPDKYHWAIHQAFFRGLNIIKSYKDSNAPEYGAHGYKMRKTDGALDIHQEHSLDNNGNLSQTYQDVWFIDDVESQRTHKLGEWSPFSNSMGGGSHTPQNNDGTTGGTVIEIGFGGIQPSKTDAPGKDPTSNWGTKVYNVVDGGPLEDNIITPEHYDLENNNRYEGAFGEDFSKFLHQGVRFRWREDPTGTIYTVTGKDIYNAIRYEGFKGGGWNNQRAMNIAANDYRTAEGYLYGGQPDTGSTSRKRISGYAAWMTRGFQTSTFYRPENFTRNYRLTLDKPIVWNPFNGGGQITNSSTVTLTASSALTGSPKPNTITVSNFSGTGTGESSLSVGMVLVSYGAGNVTNNIPSGAEMVVAEMDNTSYDIKFKFYDGNVDESTTSFPDPTGPNPINSGDTLTFKQFGMNGLSPNSAKNINYFNDGGGFGGNNSGVDAVGYTLEIVEAQTTEAEMPRFPAVWETEPKEGADLDIYYEVTDNNVSYLDVETIKLALPVGSTLDVLTDGGGGSGDLSIIANNYDSGNEILVSELLDLTDYYVDPVTLAVDWPKITVKKPNEETITIQATNITTDPSGVASIIEVDRDLFKATITSSWHNCFAFGNGVESNRVRDSFNLPFIASGVKVSTTLSEQYKEEHRKYGLIYSGIYNSTSGVNNLNQFIAAEKITKDINPVYGSIQKLKAGWGQGGDLITLCEDRVLKILANKDALFNADGSSNVTATNKVLGTATPYSGEYGISTNPESFASEAYRAYFADAVRGTIMRLSMDGLTPISDHGMKDWFKDNLKIVKDWGNIEGEGDNKIIGSYDDKKDEYNITLDSDPNFDAFYNGGVHTTVTFREDVKGWVSFKSFIAENAISCANEYYTFKDGNLWRHHYDNVPRNTFYDTPTSLDYSSFTVILNDSPGSVKSFNTLNYEGSQTRVTPNLLDNDYYNLIQKEGWYVDFIKTNKETGGLPEFIEKEGKWFNYIQGEGISHSGNNIIINPDGSSTWDHAGFAIQGFGILNSPPIAITSTGCTDPTAANYNADATIDDGTCIAVILGCTILSAYNYNDYNGNGITNTLTGNPLIDINTDDGSCQWFGCTDGSTFVDNGITYNSVTNLTTFPTEAYTYGDPAGSGIIDNTECTPTILGCMDCGFYWESVNPGCCDGTQPGTGQGCGQGNSGGSTVVGSYNYNPLANTDNGSCEAVVYGCTIDSADNYSQSVNADDGTCTWTYCFNPLDTNYDAQAAVDSGNYTPSTSTAGAQPGNCLNGGCTTPTAINYNNGFNNLGNQTLWEDGSCLLCSDLDFSAFGTWAVNNETVDGQDDGQIAIYGQSTAPDGPFTYTLITYTPQGFPIEYNSTVVTSQFSNNTDLNTTNNANSVLFYNLPPGTYTVQIQSANGCIINPTYTPIINVGVVAVPGCTDPTMCLYDPAANFDDGSCNYELGCDDPIADNYDDTLVVGEYCTTNATTLNFCIYSGGNILSGCIDPAAANYDSNANTDNGSCQYSGCTDSSAINYDNTADVDDGSCYYNPGCMDPLYIEYDPTADFDDGTYCQTLIVFGCTDNGSSTNGAGVVNDENGDGATAWDYDPNANFGTGACSLCLHDPSLSNEGVWNITASLSGDYLSSPTYVEYPAASGNYWTNSITGQGLNSGDSLNMAPGLAATGSYDGSSWVSCDPGANGINGPVACDGGGNIYGQFSAGFGNYDIGDIVLGSNGAYYILTSDYTQLHDPAAPTNWYDGANPWSLCSSCAGCL